MLKLLTAIVTVISVRAFYHFGTFFFAVVLYEITTLNDQT